MESTPSSTGRRRGFTLIELLVVVAVIGVLVSTLLPALGAVRASSQNSVCVSNIRQLVLAQNTYAHDYDGKYPPNLVLAPDSQTEKFNMYWYDENRLGRYLPNLDDSNILPSNAENSTIGGGAVTCPNHPSGGRSYTMNFWASSAGSWENTGASLYSIVSYLPGKSPLDPSQAERGRAFDSSVRGGRASSTILMIEAWGLFSSEEDPNNDEPESWFAIAQSGEAGLPGLRFGAGDGLPNLFAGTGQWQQGGSPELGGATTAELDTYVPYYRHVKRTEPLSATGQVNIGFVDGHVDGLSQADLANDDTGRSSYKAEWSPIDEQLEDEFFGTN